MGKVELLEDNLLSGRGEGKASSSLYTGVLSAKAMLTSTESMIDVKSNWKSSTKYPDA